MLSGCDSFHTGSICNETPQGKSLFFSGDIIKVLPLSNQNTCCFAADIIAHQIASCAKNGDLNAPAAAVLSTDSKLLLYTKQ